MTVEEMCEGSALRVSRHHFRRPKYNHGMAALNGLILLPVVLWTAFSWWMMVSIAALVIAVGGHYYTSWYRTNRHNARLVALRRKLRDDPLVHMFDQPWKADGFLHEKPYPSGEITIFEDEHHVSAILGKWNIRTVFLCFDDDYDRVMFKLTLQ